MADAENLKIQLQINAAIAERSKLLNAQTSQISTQVELATQFCKAMKCEDIDKITERIAEIRAGLGAAKKAADNATGGINDLVNGLDKATGSTQNMKTAAEEAQESFKKFANDFGSGFGKATAIAKGFVKSITAIGQGIFSLGLSLLKLPLTVFDKMAEAAGEMASDTSIFEAKERIREEFGDLNSGLAKQVISAQASISQALAKSGRSIASVFGTGPQGIAASFEAAADLAKGLGDVVNILGEDFDKAAGDLYVFKTGMGLANEDIKGLVVAATVSGQKVGDLAGTIQKLSQDFAKMGFSTKGFARDMTYMLTNTVKYGKLSAAQVAATTAYVKKLGLEVKQIESLNAAFDDFETAATNASKLAQAFGMQVDAMKMMKEQDPGKRLQMLRDSFRATGKSIDQMTRQEKQLLAQTAGLDESIVEQALSTKNMGKSYKQLSDESEKSAKKQKSQQEMFEELGNAIKKMTEALSYSGGFFNQFLSGMGEGIKRSGPMRQVLRDMGGALRSVRMFGREVGDMFVKMFPGVKQMLDALHEFFKGGNFKKTLNDFREVFKKFFLDLEKDPKKALDNFYQNLKKKFTDIFDRNSSAGKGFIEGAKKFLVTVGAIIAGGIKIVGEHLADGIKRFADFIRNPDQLVGKAKTMGQTFFDPILASMADVLPKIASAMGDLFKALLIKLAPTIIKYMSIYLTFAITMGLMSAVTGGVKAAIGEVVKNAILKKFGAAVSKAAAPTAPPGMGAGAGGAVGGFIDGFAKISLTGIAKAGAKMLAIAAMLTVAAAAMVGGMILIGKLIAAGGGMGVFIEGLEALAAGILAIVGITFAAKFISPGAILKASAGMLAATLFLVPLGLFVYALNQAVQMVGPIDSNAILAFSTAAAIGIGAIAIAFGAAALAGAALMTLGGWVAVGAALLGLGLIAASLYAFGEFMGIMNQIVSSIGPIDSKSIIDFSLATAAALGSMAIAFAATIIAGGAVVFAAAAAGLLGLFGPATLWGIGKLMQALDDTVSKMPIDATAVSDYSKAVAESLGWLAIAFGAVILAGAAAVIAAAGAALLAIFGIATMGYLGLFFETLSSITSQIKIDPAAVTAFTDALNSALGDVIIAFGYTTAAGAAAVVAMVGAALLASTGVAALNMIMTFFEVGLFTTINEMKSKIKPDEVATFTKSATSALGDVINLFGYATLAGLASVGALLGAWTLSEAGVSAMKNIGKFFQEGLTPLFKMDGAQISSAGEIMAGVSSTLRQIIDSMVLLTTAGEILIANDIAGLFGLVDSPMQVGFRAIGGFLKSIEKDLVPSLKGIAGVNVPTGVDQVVGLIANLMSGMAPALEMFMKVHDSAGGWFTSSATKAENTKKMIDSLGTFIQTISKSASSTFAIIIVAANSLTVDEGLQKRFEMVAKAVDMTTKLISSFTGILSALPKIEKGKADTAASVARAFIDALNAMRSVIFGPNGMIKSITSEIPRVIDMMRGAAEKLPKDPKELAKLSKRVEVIGKIVEAIATMGSTLSELSGAIPQYDVVVGSGKDAKVIKRQMTNIKGYFATITEAIGPQLQVLANKFMAVQFTMDLKSMREQAKKIYIVMNTFKDLSQFVSGMQLKDVTTNAKKDVPRKETIEEAVTRISNAGMWVLSGMRDMSNWINRGGGAEQFAIDSSNVQAALAGVPEAYEKMTTTFDKIKPASQAIGSFTKAAQAEIVEQVRDAVVSMNELDEILKDLHIGPIDATIDRLAKNMEISKESISINHKPININLQMHVSFKAEEFTKDVFKVAGKLTKEGNFNLSTFAKKQYEEAEKSRSGR